MTQQHLKRGPFVK